MSHGIDLCYRFDMYMHARIYIHSPPKTSPSGTLKSDVRTNNNKRQPAGLKGTRRWRRRTGWPFLGRRRSTTTTSSKIIPGSAAAAERADYRRGSRFLISILVLRTSCCKKSGQLVRLAIDTGLSTGSLWTHRMPPGTTRVDAGPAEPGQGRGILGSGQSRAGK